jgi:uncharacterized protein (TIGR02147 family)
MPNIFTYYDYRVFLRDYIEEQKADHTYFSLRYISRKMGVDAGRRY